MLSWGTKRKVILLGIIGLFLLVVAAVFLAKALHKSPTCFDGKQNQNELDIDCGGPCVRVCKNQAVGLQVHWKRFLPVSDGRYNAVAYLENFNKTAGTKEFKYSFKLYNKEGILIAEKLGTTMIPPNQIFAVFEPNIFTGDNTPTRMEFEFTTPDWVTVPVIPVSFPIVVRGWSNLNVAPILEAQISNTNKIDARSFEVAVIVYDEEQNARTVSQTIVDELNRGETAKLYFTWPAAFHFQPARVEILPKMYPGINY